MAKLDAPRVAVLGAGPIGLESAVYARRLNWPVTIYERGRVGENLHRWGHVRLFSPFGMNVTPLGRAAIRADQAKAEFPADGDCILGREHVKAYLEPLAKSALLRDCLRTEAQVVHVGRRGYLKGDKPGSHDRAGNPFHLLLRDKTNRESIEEADVVLDCTGTYGAHRWLGDGGIPAPGETAAEAQIAYGLEDVLGERRGHYAGKAVLVVGGGYSAATTVCHLASLVEKHPEMWIVWLARVTGTQPMKRIANDPLKERDRLAQRANMLATRGEGNVEFHNQSVVEAIEFHGFDRGFKVMARCAGKSRTWEVDRLIGNVGYSPDPGLYRELQVHECYASLGPMKLAAALLKQGGGDCLQTGGHEPEALRNPEPNFFILGAKSFGRNSYFLLGTGFEQVRDIFALLAGKPGLDLYRDQK